MNKISRLLTLALFTISLLSQAQDPKAKEILEDLSEKTRKYNTITSEFTFSLDDKAADVHQTQEGTLKMKGKKYYIHLGDNEIYSDGSTRWTYSSDMDEVYIDNVAGNEDVLNPSEIYTVWESGFKHYYDKEITLDGRAAHVIKLNPTNPDEESFHTIKLYVDKAKNEVMKIEILGKQGDNITYKVKSFNTDVPYTDKNFVFDVEEHPAVTVIDNR